MSASAGAYGNWAGFSWQKNFGVQAVVTSGLDVTIDTFRLPEQRERIFGQHTLKTFERGDLGLENARSFSQKDPKTRKLAQREVYWVTPKSRL